MSSQLDFEHMFVEGKAADPAPQFRTPQAKEKREASKAEAILDSTKWRTILSMEMRGCTKAEISQALGCSYGNVVAITNRPEYKEMREELLGQADREFLDLKPLAIGALRNGLNSNDENTALRASDQFFRVSGYGSYGQKTEGTENATAENVARALLQQALQVNVTVNLPEKKD